ncbi:cardiolipin synthase ClsB [Piscinibacter sp. XHJ-5]|uniref:cardiolipin synthase ClsB n=1 Tax=Piscinibacter sp. XHJ-5 TaxID=3037797 RepID=UPI0024532C03|nr:cardiolipin synthase ClsB [Piscinibacter sp. XHJ-5]
MTRNRPRWIDGNRFELLENGEEFFPAVFDAIRRARREVLIETFILFDDKVGRELRDVLIEAALRGVSIDLTIDGYGSPDLSEDYIAGLTASGVRLHVFDPCPKLFGRYRIKVFRRLHRKMVVVDGVLAFVGGINYSADHLGDYGPEAKQDYAVKIEGPLVAPIHRLAVRTLPSRARWPFRRPAPTTFEVPRAGDAQAMLVTRDNDRHPNDIERHYRAAIRAARREVIIANAYFFPGYRLLNEMRKAARRGVDVTLIVQGKPDMQIVSFGARLLYPDLLAAGVSIHEYCRRPLHGKVALVDDEWSTIGSSNLDPLSLALNLEANVIIRHRGFNAELREHMQRLIDEHCTRVETHSRPPHTGWRVLVSTVVFHFLRRFPSWAQLLPPHRPRVESVAAHSGALDARHPLDPSR